MFRALTLDDVALVPQCSDIESRRDPSLITHITKDRSITMPIVNSPMDTVIGPEMAKELWRSGGIPILHRFYKDVNAIGAELEKIGCPVPVYISCGLLGWSELSDLSRIITLRDNVIGFNVDVAHGHSRRMIDSIGKLKHAFPNHEVIAGAVCTPGGFRDLVNAGADAVRVGIGNGSACITRMVTGFGVPQFSALTMCAAVAKDTGVPMIADGGIRDSRDIVISLAAGASTVMIGKLLAQTEESPAPKRGIDASRQAQYRGQASEEFQKDHYGGVKQGAVPEGIDFWTPVSGSVKEVIQELLQGVKSGMTYANAMTISELQTNAQWVEVTSTYLAESRPRVY